MKYIVNILLFLSVSIIVSAQDTLSNWKFGLEVQSKLEEKSDFNITPRIFSNYKRHSLYLGPLFVNDITGKLHQDRPVFGIQIEYQINPIKTGKVLNCFISYDVNLVSGQITDNNSNYFNSGPYWYLATQTIDKVFYCSNYICVGLKLHFLKFAYITTSFGLGKSWIKEEITWTMDNGDKYSEHSNEGTGNLIPQINIGLGCQLIKLKKK